MINIQHFFLALYNGTLSYEILQNTTLREKLLQQLASYKPTVTIAKSSTLHHHTIYYPSNAFFMQKVIEALENLPILAENASTIESQALVAQTLMHISLQFSRNMQHGETHHCFFVNYYHRSTHNSLLILIVILEVKRETYTGVMAIDWQDTYVSILSLVARINYIYTSIR